MTDSRSIPGTRTVATSPAREKGVWSEASRLQDDPRYVACGIAVASWDLPEATPQRIVAMESARFDGSLARINVPIGGRVIIAAPWRGHDGAHEGDLQTGGRLTPDWMVCVKQGYLRDGESKLNPLPILAAGTVVLLYERVR